MLSFSLSLFRFDLLSDATMAMHWWKSSMVWEDLESLIFGLRAYAADWMQMRFDSVFELPRARAHPLSLSLLLFPFSFYSQFYNVRTFCITKYAVGCWCLCLHRAYCDDVSVHLFPLNHLSLAFLSFFIHSSLFLKHPPPRFYFNLAVTLSPFMYTLYNVHTLTTATFACAWEIYRYKLLRSR